MYHTYRDAPDDDTRVLAVELRIALGYSLAPVGEFERLRALLGEAEALARVLDDRVRLGQVLAGMAQVLRRTGDHNGAMAAGQQALALAAELDDSDLQVQVSLQLGSVYYGIGDLGRAAELLRRSVEAIVVTDAASPPPLSPTPPDVLEVLSDE